MSAAVLSLPLCTSAEPETRCYRGGVLAYVNGAWVHVVVPGEPKGCCDSPEPIGCVHEADRHCKSAIVLGSHCVNPALDGSCCGCCWVVEVAEPGVP